QDLGWDRATLTVNGQRKVFPLSPPDRVQAVTSSTGALSELIAAQRRTGAFTLHDDSGLASAALSSTLTIPAHGSATVGVVVPLSGTPELLQLGQTSAEHWLAREEAAGAAAWRGKLNRVALCVR